MAGRVRIPHTFVLHTYTKPTKCSFCNKVRSAEKGGWWTRTAGAGGSVQAGRPVQGLSLQRPQEVLRQSAQGLHRSSNLLFNVA
jgi:hypothetical protein